MNGNMNDYRKLTVQEIQLLKEHSCTAENWADIEVAPDFTPDYI